MLIILKNFNKKSLKITIRIFLAGILLIGFLTIRESNLNEVRFENDKSIGITGPLIIRFSLKMDHESVENHIQINPEMQVDFVWKNENLYVFPKETFKENFVYTLSLKNGFKAINGKNYKNDYLWEFTARSENIVFLHPSGKEANIWRLDLASGNSYQLTNTTGQIYDYTVSNSGNLIAYSVKNLKGGYDLWKVNRNGEENSLLLDCEKDWCIEPDFSRLDDKLTFTRISDENGSETKIKQRLIWLIDLNTFQSLTLLKDNSLQGEQSLWSPDGRYLAFYDPEKEYIHVLDMETNLITDFSANSGIIGSWLQDSNILLYTENTEDILVFTSEIFKADPVNGLRNKSGAGDFIGEKILSRPLISPDGNWVLVSAKDPSATGASQLWVVYKDGEFGQMITDDYLATHNAYSWSNSGTKLVYQRLKNQHFK